MMPSDNVDKPMWHWVLRQQLERALRTQVPDPVWTLLLLDHYVDRYVAGEAGGFTDLFNRAQELTRVLSGPRDHPSRTEVDRAIAARDRIGGSAGEVTLGELAADRQRALSYMLALEVGKDARVRAYRTEILGGQLLQWEQVDQWIQEQSRASGPPTWWITDIPIELAGSAPDPVMPTSAWVPDRDATIHEEWRPYQPGELLDRLQATSLDDLMATFRPRVYERHYELRFLWYLVPGEASERCVPTTVAVSNDRGVPVPNALHRLRELSEQLAIQCGWTPAQATVFILTDRVPLVDLVTHTYDRREIPGTPRIVLTVDPVAAPEEVLDYYRSVRQELLGMRERQRAITAKEICLSFFLSQRQPLSSAETWAARRADWNEHTPKEWRYSQTSNFQRDCQRVRRWFGMGDGERERDQPEDLREETQHGA